MGDGGFQQVMHEHLAVGLAAFSIKWSVFWPYFAGAALLAIGLPIIIRNELPEARGLDKILPFGRLFFAVPTAVFGTEHLTDPKDIALIVPSWMPAHMFWVYLVGIALIAAALSIVVKRCARPAATLLGIMFLIFVALIHIPNIVAQPGDRLFWMIGLRDTAFSGGAFALAGARMRRGTTGGAPWLVTLGRFFIAIPAVIFGVEHFLHPAFVPGVPLERLTPTWIPGHIFWAYLAGAVLIIAGACLLLNQKARLAATYLGIMIFLLVLVIYLPILAATPLSIANRLNYFADTLMFSGAALVLADACP